MFENPVAKRTAIAAAIGAVVAIPLPFIGPIVGALLMFYLVEWTSDVTQSYRIVVGAALVLLTLFFPKGLLGTLREQRLRWLP